MAKGKPAAELSKQLDETQQELDKLLSRRISFPVGDMLEHGDSLLGNLGKLLANAKELKKRRDRLAEEMELAKLAGDEMQTAIDNLGGWIED